MTAALCLETYHNCGIIKEESEVFLLALFKQEIKNKVAILVNRSPQFIFIIRMITWV